MQLIVAEGLGRHQVGAPAVAAAEQHRVRPAPGADRQEPGRIRRVESHVIADDPDLLRPRVAGRPASEILPIEHGFPPVVGPGRRG